jgi:hypothetical protein
MGYFISFCFQKYILNESSLILIPKRLCIKKFDCIKLNISRDMNQPLRTIFLRNSIALSYFS